MAKTSLLAGLPGKQFDPKLPEPVKETFEEEKSPDVYRKPRFLMPVGIVVSIFSAYVSMYNSFEWFASLRPVHVALPMAITMVASSILLPDFGILLFRAKKRFMGGAILLAGIMAIGFCMVTTVAAFYTTHAESMRASDAAAKEERDAELQLRLSDSERVRLLEEIKRLDAQIDSTQAKIDGIPAAETLSAASQALQRRLLGYQSARAAYEAQLGEGVRTARLPATPSARKPDFFSFVAGNFNLTPGQAELFISTVPAIFLELVAPVMVAVVLFI